MFWHIFFGHYTQETQLKIERKYFYHFKTIEVKAFLKKKNPKTTHQYLLKYIKSEASVIHEVFFNIQAVLAGSSIL